MTPPVIVLHRRRRVWPPSPDAGLALTIAASAAVCTLLTFVAVAT